MTDSSDVCDEQPASDPPRSTRYFGAIAPLAVRPSDSARYNGILGTPYDPSLRLNGVSGHRFRDAPFDGNLLTTTMRHITLRHSVNNRPVKRLPLVARLIATVSGCHRPFILYRMPVGIMG